MYIQHQMRFVQPSPRLPSWAGLLEVSVDYSDLGSGLGNGFEESFSFCLRDSLYSSDTNLK